MMLTGAAGDAGPTRGRWPCPDERQYIRQVTVRGRR